MPEKVQQPPVQQPVNLDIAVSHITFAYEDQHQVYQDFSLYCRQGAHIALVGTSGSGKSTLAALLVRFWEPQQGTISLGNIPLNQYPEQQLRQLIGVIEQDTFLFSATLRENLLLVNPQVQRNNYSKPWHLLCWNDVAATLPDGLDTYIGDNGYRLSGGQRQRVALARAWLRDCPVVILDEIFQGLDTITAAQIRHNLEQWGRGPHHDLYYPYGAATANYGADLCIGSRCQL